MAALLAGCSSTSSPTAAPPDAAPPLDASLDALDAPSATYTHSPSPCGADAGAHTLCADFDGPNFLSGWDGLSGDPNMQMAQYGSLSLCASPPACAASWVQATSARAHAEVTRGITERPSALASSFVFLDRCSTVAPASLEIVRFDVSTDYEIALVIEGGAISLVERAGPAPAATIASQRIAPYAVSADWVPLALSLTVVGASPSATVTTPMGTSTVKLSPSASVVTANVPVGVGLGLAATPATAPCIVYYDNFTFDLTPLASDAGAD